MKQTLRAPFFVVNPKAYLYGDKLLDLAKVANDLATRYDLDILFTAQHIDLAMIKQQCPKLFVTAQHLDGFSLGRGMGHILPEALASVGVQATFLNHAEHAMTLSELVKAMEFARNYNILTIVCANSYEEVKAIASLKPDVMVCEPNELIGTGQTSDDNYMIDTQKLIKEISPQTQVLQAAGISTVADVERAFKLGAEGTGGTSGIVCAENPQQILTEMIEKTALFKNGGI
ncbi:triose-phosphate isomerase [Vagococcus penaei]|uniref:Triose-phosphate isomerase n=1 Tax=Vagococcus penaei TaxID=633807 RepID=A0A1Q2D4Z5_9ENTE|nr:triose-phosphate isomerase [Vagococcus penaei]AQP53277.1 triose-phosphate isomerase [Vagococcus penaei]RSU04045.1 triose-phosphate isomerase [Vagococcus penaei]